MTKSWATRVLGAALAVIAFVPGAASGQAVVPLAKFKLPLPRPGQIELVRLDSFPAPGSPRLNRVELCLDTHHLPGTVVVVGDTTRLELNGEHGFTSLLLAVNAVKAPAAPAPEECKLTWYGSGGPHNGPTGTVYVTLAGTAAPGFQGYMFAVCHFLRTRRLALAELRDGFDQSRIAKLSPRERAVLNATVHGTPIKACPAKPPVDPGPEALLLLDAPPVHPVQLEPGPKATVGTPKKLLAAGIRLFTAEANAVATTGEIIAEIERAVGGDLTRDGKVGTPAPALYRYSIPGFTVSYTGPAANHAPVITQAFAGGSGCGDPAKDAWLVPFTESGFGTPRSSTARLVFAQNNPYTVITDRYESPTGAAQAQTALRYLPGAPPAVKVEFTKQGDVTGVMGAPKTLPVKLEPVKSCG